LRWLEGALGALGVVLVVLTLWRERRLLAVAIAAFAAEIVVRGGASVTLALYGAGLLTLGELASLSLSLRAVARVERAVLVRRCAALALVAVGALAVGALVALASHAAVRGGLAAGAAGVAATVAAVGLVAVLARSRGT